MFKAWRALFDRACLSPPRTTAPISGWVFSVGGPGHDRDVARPLRHGHRHQYADPPHARPRTSCRTSRPRPRPHHRRRDRATRRPPPRPSTDLLSRLRRGSWRWSSCTRVARKAGFSWVGPRSVPHPRAAGCHLLPFALPERATARAVRRLTGRRLTLSVGFRRLVVGTPVRRPLALRVPRLSEPRGCGRSRR